MRNTLLDMLTYCRPMGSRTERDFRARYLENLPGAWTDPYGNIHVSVGTSRCLWSCHTDTVHTHDGRQRVQVTAGRAHLPKQSRSRCLGADDTAGVYLMREMIRYHVPGYYVFHWGEERGGIGSRALAEHHPDMITREFDHAIALDRRGTGDVITHQGYGRSASDAFAVALADQLGDLAGLTYAPAHGIYTDTAEYAELIPECSNLSVGYRGEHTPHEELDLRHVDRLLGALCDLDTAALPIARVALEPWADEDEWMDRYTTPAYGRLSWDEYVSRVDDIEWKY